MRHAPKQISLTEWDTHYDQLITQGMQEPSYGGRLSRHLDDGDQRLTHLLFDNAPESLHLWNFLLTENERLRQARISGKKLVGAMKDLGTVPVMAYSLPDVVAFYPDGAWWIPCVMELGAGLLNIADSLGIDESFCPVRAMLGAFVTEAHFPIPDLLTCSVGATCDDFSAIAQRIEGLGHPILWWEIPHRRHPEEYEESIELPGEFVAPKDQVNFVKEELTRIRQALEDLTGTKLDDQKLAEGINKANHIRSTLRELRELVFTAKQSPLPALELLVAEMFALHFCSDRDEALVILQNLLKLVKQRINDEQGYFSSDAIRIFWVNPVADLRVMNILEDCGGRICGTEYLFSHALDPIPEDIPPMEALSRIALADPMVGAATDRATRICNDCRKYGAEAVVISSIPGASHCAQEGNIIAEEISRQLSIPVTELEVPPLCDAVIPRLQTRLQALIEIAR